MGWCQFGDKCRYVHMAFPAESVSGEVCRFFSKTGWCKHGETWAKGRLILVRWFPLRFVEDVEVVKFMSW